MKRFLTILASVSVFAMAVSCDLDLTPKGKVTYNPGDPIITSASDLESFEVNIMSNLRALEYGDYDQVSDVMVDYFNALADYGNNYGPVHKTDANFTASDYDTEANWANPYTAIKNFNIFIHGAQSVPAGLEEDAAIARGEAYFGRAFAYLHLARHFGKAYSANAATDLCVPLVTVYDQTARPERATVKAVYDQIKTDLDSAAVLLAGVEGEVRAQRPTIDAVNALYARYYLDTQNYASAAAAAMSVINTGKYELSSTPEEMKAEWIDDEGKEPIMQYYATLQEGVGSHSIYAGLANDKDMGPHFREYFIPTKKLVDAYEEGDLRFGQWFTDEYPTFHSGTYYNVDKHDYYNFVKYFGNPDLYTGLANTGQAIKPLLISEMYLIAAEAYAASGAGADAKTALNTLQEKRGATATTASLDNIKKEWYKEVVGEGLYFSCLKRWGQGYNGRAPQTGAEGLIAVGESLDKKVWSDTDYHFQWPVPTYEMQTNLNLKQNDGYGVTSAE